ncbi:MAG TPA: murein biosynthesis integral membrane protein MurJ [bacterium]|nr:murein biosynthesis integral membrane protein MurJ [bacterium]
MASGEVDLTAARRPAASGGLARAASLIAAGTIASRVLGLVRDVVIAAMFGATSVKSAFVIAYSLPFFVQRLFLGGTLSIVFIPTITRVLMRGDAEETDRVVTSTFNLVIVIGLLMVVVGVLAAPVLVPIAAPGYLTTNPSVLTQAIGLTRVMFVSMVFLALSAFATGYLNVHRQFGVPALAPTVFNLVIIGGVLVLAPRIGVLGIAFSFLAGWIAQFVVQLPAARAAGLRWSPKIDLAHPVIREMGRLALPAMLGLAVIEINANVNRFFASFLRGTPGVDYVAVLDYAFQLIQAPVAIFALSLATALFPTMARHAAGSGHTALRETTSLGLRGVFFTMMPVMAAIFTASHLMVRVIFERGVFQPAATQAVAAALVAFAVGTVPYAAYYIVTRTYYALHDMRTPVRVGLFMIALNAIGNFVLMRRFGFVGISLCTSGVAAANVAVLLWLLRGRLGGLGGREILVTAVRTTIAAAALAAVMVVTLRVVGGAVSTQHLSGALVQLGAALLAGGAVYLAVCAVLGVEELELLRAFGRGGRA